MLNIGGKTMPKNKGEINIIGPKKELNAITFEKRGKAKPKQDKKNNKNVISISTKRDRRIFENR